MNLFHFIFRRVYIRFDYLCLIFETLNIKITTLMLQKTFLARCGSSSNLVVISFLFQLSSSFLILLKVVDMFAF